MKFRFKDLINTEAGLVSGNLNKIPNRAFIPICLYMTSLLGENLDVVGCNITTIKASGIDFSINNSIESTFRAFCEKYCSSLEKKEKIKIGTYKSLISAGYNSLHPNNINFFRDYQFTLQGFLFKRFTCEDEIEWVECFDYLTNESIFIPIFLVYSGKTQTENKYNLETSIGLACGSDLISTFESAMLDNFKKHAIADFWYNQKELQFIKYSKNLILEAFPNNKNIQKLYDNDKMDIVVFDLTKYSCVETIVTID